MKENQAKHEAEPTKKGLKLPWYVGYPILIIAIILSIFLGYKAITGNNVISTMAKVDNSVFSISINKEEINVGEIIKIESTKYK